MASRKQLVTIKERIFLQNIFQGMSQSDAYRNCTTKEITEENAQVMGWKYMQRLKRKVPWEKILDIWGLGIERIGKALDEQLKATAPRFHQGEHLGDWPDNAARGRALDMLIDIHKLKVQRLEVTGKDGGPVETLNTLNDIIKYHEQHNLSESESQPDSDEVSE